MQEGYNNHFKHREGILKSKFAEDMRKLEIEETIYHMIDKVNMEDIAVKNLIDAEAEIIYRVGTVEEMKEILESHPTREAEFDGAFRIATGANEPMFPLWLKVTHGNWPFEPLNVWIWHTSVGDWDIQIKVGCDELVAQIQSGLIKHITGFQKNLKINDTYFLYGCDECCLEDIV